MSLLKQKLASQVPDLRKRVVTLAKSNGNKVVADVSAEQVLGGMRGVTSLVCDTSEVGPHTGLISKGTPILELTDKLPEEIFWLLLTGELPNEAELKDLQSELRKRAEV